MTQQSTNCNGLVVGMSVLDREPTQILGDRSIEANSILVAQLHEGDRGEELRDRADAVDGLCSGWRAGVGVRQSEAACCQEFLIVDDADRCGRHAADTQLVFDPGFPGSDRIGNARIVTQRPGGGFIVGGDDWCSSEQDDRDQRNESKHGFP